MLLGFMLSLGSLTRCEIDFSNLHYHHDVSRKSHEQLRSAYILSSDFFNYSLGIQFLLQRCTLLATSSVFVPHVSCMGHGRKRKKCLRLLGNDYCFSSFPIVQHTTSMIFSQKISSKFLSRFISIRLLATGVYLLFLVLTMFLAFYPHKIFARGLLLVISIAIQFLALCKCPILSRPILSCPSS
jgi:hypothetical protein